MKNRLTAKVLVVAAISAAAAAAGVPGVYATAGTWNNSGATTPQLPPTATPTFAATLDATQALNWLNGVIPNAPGDTANFTYDVNAAKILNMGNGITYGTINLGADAPNDGNAYTLDATTAGFILNLDRKSVV
jgi:hypothetical protein